MKCAESVGLRQRMQRIGVGLMALTLAATFSMPASVAAKEKTSSKATATKQVSKKSGKKIAKAVKKTRQDKKTLKESRSKNKHKASVKRKDKKANRKTLSRASKAVRKHLSRKSASTPSHQVWNPSDEPQQAYYLMPDSLAGGNAGEPQYQPVAGEQPVTDEQPVVRVQNADNREAKADSSGKEFQVGKASYYAGDFHGKRTASGERYDQNDLTCAHGSLPFGCRIRVTNMRNNKSVDVKVNDRGGFSKHGRVIDLSKAAAKEIGMVATGTAKVKIEVLD